MVDDESRALEHKVALKLGTLCPTACYHYLLYHLYKNRISSEVNLEALNGPSMDPFGHFLNKNSN